MAADRSPSMVTVSQIADLAEVGPSAVSNWRKRFDDFPAAGEAAAGGRDLFQLEEVERWLRRHGRLGDESKDKRALFEAADLLRSEVASGPLVEILGAALALLAIVRRRRTGSAAGPSAASLLSVADSMGPELAAVFQPLRRIERATAEQVLGLVCGVGSRDLTACLDWVVSRGPRSSEAHSGTVLTRLLVALVGGDPVKAIYDPAAGSGGFLLALSRASPVGKPPELFGQELNASAWRVARQRALIADAAVSLARGDSLLEDAWPELRADVVVCDPPYSSRKSWPASATGDPRWLSGRPPARTDFAWLQHVAYHLSREGSGYVFLPAGSLFRSGREADLRRQLLAEGVVEAIVGLPRGSAHNTAIPLALWILRRPGAGAERDSVLILDSTRLGPPPRAMLDSAAMERIATVLHGWRSGAGVSQRDRTFATAVPVFELMRGVANLAPARWVGSELTASDRSRQEAEFAERLRDLDRSRAAFGSALAIADPAPARSPRRWIRVDQLLDGGGGEVVRGARIAAGDCAPTGTVPVMRPHHVLAGLASTEEVSFVGPGSAAAELPLTKPGDVILAPAAGRLAAVVDRRGGYVLAAPLQGLRLARGSLEPELVAAFLESPRNRRLASGTTLASVRIGDLEVPVLPPGEATELLGSLRELREQELVAGQIGACSRRLREILLALASASPPKEGADE
jgi:N-6 DNA methylase